MRGKYLLLLSSSVILLFHVILLPSSAEVQVYRSLQDFLAAQNSHRGDEGDDNNDNGGDNSSSSTEIVDSRRDMVSSSFSQGHHRGSSPDNEGKGFDDSDDDVDDSSESVFPRGIKLQRDERQKHVSEDQNEEQDEDNEKGNLVKTSDNKKNIFIYLPFRPTTRISQSTSTKSPFSPVNIVKSSTTPRRPTFSTTFPTNRTRNLPVTSVISKNLSSRASISLPNRGSQWQPIPRNESLKASASSRTHFVSSPTLYYATSQQRQHDTPSKTQVIHQQHVVSDVPHQSPPHEVTVVESPPESRPVHVNVIQHSPPETPPVQVNFVRHESPRDPPVVVVNEPSPRVDVVKVHHHHPPPPPPLLVHAPPRILVRSPPIVHAPPPRAVIVHSPPPRVIHHHAPPVHVVHHAPPVVRTHPVTLVHAPPPPPVLVHSPPPCAPPAVVHAPPPPPAIVHHPVVHAAPIVHHHPPPIAVHAHPVIHAAVPRAAAFYSPAVPAKTRTVYHSVQYLPEQTHVYTTTQFSPATRTTIYETDHMASYSNQHKVIVAAPPTKFVHDDPPSTIYHFPKFPSILGTRVLSVPIKIAGKFLLKGHTDLTEILPSPISTIRERRKKKKKKKKKIFVFGDDKKLQTV